jgi:hypothetical protein
MEHFDDQQFHGTFAQRMLRIEASAAALAELSSAIGSVPDERLEGFILDDMSLEAVYHGHGDLFDHYLVRTRTANVFLVFVWERMDERFVAYHLLNLNTKYGLPTPRPRARARR